MQQQAQDQPRSKAFFLQLYTWHNTSKMVDINRGAVNLLRPCKTLGAALPNLRE